MSQIIHGHELVFNEAKHHYTWNDAPVPGVTTILQCIAKPALIPWAAGMASDHWLNTLRPFLYVSPLSLTAEALEKIHKEAKGAHRRKASEAADSGTNVHEYAEAFLKGDPLPELKTEAAKKGADAFHKWMDAHSVKILASERRLFSKEYYYAGTCDLVGEVDGILSVGDFKTSSGIYPEMRFQTAAYQHALQEEKGTLFPQRLIIRFDKKTGEFEAKKFLDFDLDFLGFRSALQLHKTLKAMETK